MKIQILLATTLLAVSSFPTNASFTFFEEEEDKRGSLMDLDSATLSNSVENPSKKKTVRFQEHLPKRYEASYPSKMHDGAFAYSPTDSGIAHLTVEPYKPNRQATPVLADEYPSVEQQTSFARGRMNDPIEWFETYRLLHGCNPPGVASEYIEVLKQRKSTNTLTPELLPHFCQLALDTKSN